MPQFAGLSICDTWAAAGGAPQREVARHALVSCRGQFTVESPDQNRLAFGVRRNWDGLSALVPRSVMRLTKSDGAFDEWRLNAQDVAVLGTGVKQFEALPPIYLLAECGEYYTTGAGGIRDYSYALIDVTPAQALTALVLGTPGIPGFISIGAVDPTVRIDLESNDDGKTPLSIAFEIRDAVRGKGVPCELEFVRVGTTSYELRLVTQIGATAPVPEFAVGRNVIDYLLKYNCTQQTTRVRTKGPVDATGLSARLSRARYAVTAVNGGTKRITVADESGGAGPIQFAEQYVGWFVFRERTGRTFQILHTYPATQEIELADVSTMAAHAVTAPEWISFRESEPLAGTRRWGQPGGRWAEVTAVGAGSLTLTDNWGMGDPVDVNGRWVDWQLRRASFVLATSFTMNVVAGRLDCASVAGVQPGDVVVIGGSAAAPFGSGGLGTAPGTSQAVVDTIDVVNKYLFCTIRYAGAWSVGPLTYYARVFNPVAPHLNHLVTGSTAATNVVTVDTVNTAAVHDLIEIIQPCQGVLPTHIESPAAVASYGVKLARLDVADTGECNATPNPIMRAWTGAANVPPDGWAWSGAGAATIARSAFRLQGDYSAYCTLRAGATAGKLTSPSTRLHPIIGADLASIRLRLFITDFPPGQEWDPTFSYVFSVRSQILVQCYTRTAAGGRTPVGTPAILGCPGVGFANPVMLDTWVEAVIPGIDISALVDETLEVELSAEWGGSIPSGNIRAYVGGVQITQTPAAPRQYPELLIEYAEANKHVQQANLELLDWAMPPKECTVKLVDRERVDPVRYSADAITPGGNVRLFHAEEGVDLTVRCPSVDINYLDEADTNVTLAIIPTRFTALSGSASGSGQTASAGGGGGASTAAPRVGAVSWAQILDKPETYHPDVLDGARSSDYEARGDGAGYAVGLVRIDAVAVAIPVPRGLPAVNLCNFPIGKVRRITIVGECYGSDVFLDEIIACGVPLFSLVPLSQNTLLGAPGARTYTLMGNMIRIAIAGVPGYLYSVRLVWVDL